MVGKNNKKVIIDKNNEKQQKFAIKKLRAGVTSVAIASMVLLGSDFTLNKVQAEETQSSVAQEAIEEFSAIEPESQVVEEAFENDITLEVAELVEVSDVEVVNEFSEIDLVDSPENLEIELTAVEPSIEEIEASASEEISLFESTEDIDTAVMNTNFLAAADTAEDQALETPAVSDSAVEDPIEEGYFRFNFAGLTQEQLDTYGLWIWGDVAAPSETVGAWPDGAMKFAESRQDAYGHYLDVEMSEAAKTINFLINKMNGDNVTGDQSVNLLSPSMNQLWVDKDFGLHLYEQLDDEGLLRVNYYRQDGDYTGWSLWTWDDVEKPTQNWPSGAHEFVNEGLLGRYIDLPLAEGAKNISFLILNTITGEQSGDINFADRENHSQVFLRELEAEAYTNPYFAKIDRLETGEMLSETQISLNFSSVDEVTRESLLADLEIVDSAGNVVAVSDVVIDEETGRIMVQGQFDYLEAPYKVRYGDQELALQIGWRIKDELYAYEDQLGLDLREDGTAELKLWSPSASAVNVILYDKNDQNKVVGTWELAREDRGVWRVELNEEETGIENHTGYYYHFEIERDGAKVVVLDPYAKSLAAWDNLTAEHSVAKAAMINPSLLGPELDYAQIEGYEKREDAIIYEVHVRDFTSDPSITDQLTSQFGTFSAFVEKLDYIQSLGVTHVQLLPVMSYYYANEFANGERHLDYASTDVNYNWGYDPQSYFSLTGMYSENPEDPAKRIEEFKLLVDEIHARGMGVILDVVYNHTARTHIFEDLEPNYYHFMDADGTPRESFGGGRLGTTHAMARRILVDSIAYWTEEFKIDGFRFDMMGDHDAEAIQIAFDRAAALNPNMLMIGEGWLTFAGDETDWGVQAADQNWMSETDSVGVFSDEIRNELKSGFGSEGEARFLTGGSRNIHLIFNNIIGKPSNFNADDPGDVVQYIAAHDNLTLHDVIAQSIKKDPKYHEAEIHQRIRIGNLMILTSQGTPFIHSGQEYGRTKQYRDEDYINAVAPGEEPYKSTFMTDAEGNPFEFPYFIHDSYDSSDAVNKFDWEMATNSEAFPIQGITQDYTTGLIHLRRSTDAFRYGTAEEIANNVTLIEAPEIGQEDLVIGYQAIDSKGDIYIVFVNADETVRTISFMDHFKHIGKGEIIVDGLVAGTVAIDDPSGVALGADSLTLDPLTATIIRLKKSDSLTVTEEIAYETIERDNSELEEGVRVVVQEGIAGTRTITYEILYEYGEEVSRREVSNEVTIAPVDKIVDVGSAVVDSLNPEKPEEPAEEAPEQTDGSEEEPVESESSLDDSEAALEVNKASLLPNTGEISKLPLIGAATLIALTGASLILAARKKEEEI